MTRPTACGAAPAVNRGHSTFKVTCEACGRHGMLKLENRSAYANTPPADKNLKLGVTSNVSVHCCSNKAITQ